MDSGVGGGGLNGVDKEVPQFNRQILRIVLFGWRVIQVTEAGRMPNRGVKRGLMSGTGVTAAARMVEAEGRKQPGRLEHLSGRSAPLGATRPQSRS